MKENKDIHVLKWNIITKTEDKYNVQIYCDKKKQPNKGILFEDLIEKLLEVMFPNEVWLRTAKSHDGKKDFVYPADTDLPEQKWAECKNYNDNVSLNVISPTLIMGAIDNIECIYFFSYSPLNNNAIEGLLRYSELSNKTIKIFDGNLLESLICQYHKIKTISQFFPDTDFEEAIANFETRKFRVIKILKDMNGNSISSNHLFEIGESFYLNIIIQNLSSEYINYNLDVQLNSDNYLLCEKNNFSYGLPFGAIKEHSISCQTLQTGQLSYTINVTPLKNNFEKESTSISRSGTIKIINEPYLFWTGEKALSVYYNCMKHLTDYNKDPLIIVAPGGTGKSTLVNILLQEKAIHEKYNILKFDLNLTRNYCARNLFFQALGTKENAEIPLEQIEDDKKALSLLVDKYAESAKMIAQTMMKFYDSTHPFLFVVDDIQNINRAYIDLFGELNLESKKNKKPIYYIYTLNEDILSLDKLIVRLNWNYNYKNLKIKLEKLSKFNHKDTISFIKQKLGLPNIDHYFSEYDRDISPLELHSFCSSLKNKNIVSYIPKNSSYYIVDKFKFSESIDRILYKNISIQSIYESLEMGDVSLYILKYLYITDELGVDFREKYHLIINELIIMGILKENDGVISFYHDKIRKYIGKKLEFTEEDYVDIFYTPNTDINARAICAIYQIDRIQEAPMFLNHYFQTNKDVRKSNQRYRICFLVFEYLDKLLTFGIASHALKFVYNNIDALNIEQEYNDLFDFFCHIARSAQLFNWDINNECVEHMAFFIKKFFDRALSTHNERIIHENYTSLKNILLNLTNISQERKFYWLAHFSNRAAIACDRMSNPFSPEPIDVSIFYEQTEDYFKKTGDNIELALQITVDNFNRHYFYRHNLSFKNTNYAYRKLVELKRHGVTKKLCLDYHMVLLAYLSFKLDEINYLDRSRFLSNLIKGVSDIRIKSNSAFYTLKLFMLEIYILIDLGRYSQANNLLTCAFEFAYKKGIRRSIHKLTYIQANLLQFDNNLGSLFELNATSQIAFEQLLEARKNTSNDLKREIFLIIRLFYLIRKTNPKYIDKIIVNESEITDLLQQCWTIQDKTTSRCSLFGMRSYFVINGVDFPLI
ncbi:MAG: ATP-binding protein [Clostridia bacterium]|nr:ATP-binding protein [Clostridia bacterium]